jgi:hypothetical protein
MEGGKKVLWGTFCAIKLHKTYPKPQAEGMVVAVSKAERLLGQPLDFFLPTPGEGAGAVGGGVSCQVDAT